MSVSQLLYFCKEPIKNLKYHRLPPCTVISVRTFSWIGIRIYCSGSSKK